MYFEQPVKTPPTNPTIDKLFNEGEELLTYGSSDDYPFDSSASRHWRMNARRILHIAHCLSILERSDEEVFNNVMMTLKEE